MSSESCYLKDVAEVVDSLHKTPQYSDYGEPMVRVTDVKYGELDLSKTLRVDQNVFAEFSRRYKPSRGDIIVTRVGTYGVFGKVLNTNFCLGQNTAAIIPKEICSNYLYAVLNSYFIKSQIESSVVGSTQKTLSLKAIKDLQVPRFPPSQERSIGNLISEFDDRITLLREINQTLEAIAQALFKSWFVDFDPVRAKAEGRLPDGIDEATAALFPDAFEETEIGIVPMGWVIGRLNDFAKLKGGKMLSKDHFSVDGEFPVYGGAGEMGRSDMSNAEGFVITVGRVGAYCGQYFWHSGKAWVNNNASHVIPHNVNYSVWLYQWLRSVDMDLIKKGAAQPFVSNGDIENLQIILPDASVIEEFVNVCEPLFERMSSVLVSISTLTNLRDTLLPRLISGQLRIADAEAELEKVMA